MLTVVEEGEQDAMTSNIVHSPWTQTNFVHSHRAHHHHWMMVAADKKCAGQIEDHTIKKHLYPVTQHDQGMTADLITKIENAVR